MKTYSVLSMNMRTNALSHPFSLRAPAAVQLIETYEPDLIGSQELTDSMARQIQSLYTAYGIFGLPRHSLIANEYNLIFFRRERFQFIAGNTFWLSSHPEQRGSHFLLSQFPRIVTYAVLRDKTDDSVLTIFNTHLDHLFASVRFRQADVLAELIRRYHQGNICILTGDFNDISGSRAMTPLEHTDLKDCINDDIGLTITHPFDRIRYHNKPIDHIFVSKEARILKTEKITARFNGISPSDHYPVMAIISFA